MTDTNTTMEPGCYLDSHRGHYITRDMIDMAEGFGYILDPFTAYAVSTYDSWTYEERGAGLSEALYDLSDDILDWLNGGPNAGLDRAIPGQNSPPAIPEDHSWQWNDGDFGLYPAYDEFADGEPEGDD